jgi:hypothetical protein
MGVLSWHIEEGAAGGADLAGFDVVLALRYDDDEPGSPWDFVLYVDERATGPRKEALEAIYTGRWGGSPLLHFPWAWKASRLRAVRSAGIELEHRRERGRILVRDRVRVRIAHPVREQPTVTCVIPGHHQAGEEIVADELHVDDEVAFSFAGVCGYASVFDYSSDETAASGS